MASISKRTWQYYDEHNSVLLTFIWLVHFTRLEPCFSNHFHEVEWASWQQPHIRAGLVLARRRWSLKCELFKYARRLVCGFVPDICQIFSTLNICDETCFQRRAAAIESTRHVLRAKPWGNGSLNRRRSTFNIQHCCCYSYTHKYSIHVNIGHSAMQKHCNMSTEVLSTGLGSCRNLAGDQTDHQEQVCSSILITICYLENIASHIVLLKWLSS